MTEFTEQPALELKDLSKEIGGQTILKGITLAARQGEILGIVGPDGSGKSTLLKVAAGVWPLNSGTISIQGNVYTRLPQEVRNRIGYMAFDEGLYEDLSAVENLRYTALLYQFPAEQTGKRIEELLQKTELVDFKNLPVKFYSGGMKQKLALCCALLHRPQILLLDEPSTGIDPHSRRVFWELLFDLPEEGATILITTPYFDEVERCRRVALLSEGQVILSGSPKTLYKNSNLTALDLKPENMIEAVDFLEDQNQIETYRVKGSSIHVVCRREALLPEEVVQRAAQAGVSLQNSHSSNVEMEDLFYLHLKKLSPELDEKTNFRTSWIWPKENPPATPLIEALSIRKNFGSVEAVRDCSFSVFPGEIFGLIGSNGAGKTTTLRMLCGLLRPDEGRANLLGKDPERERSDIQPKIGYMSQHFSLYQDLIVLENIQFYGGIYSLSGDSFEERVEWTLNITALEKHAHRFVRDLPTGWKQRLALGCTLLHDPAVIFLDEPTSGVDPITKRYFWHWISFLAQQGRTILVTTHDMAEAEQCHRVLLMHRGSVLALGAPEAICESESRNKILIDLACSPFREAMNSLREASVFKSVNPFGNHLHLSALKFKFSEDRLRSFLKEKKIHCEELTTIPYSIEDVFVERIEDCL